MFHRILRRPTTRPLAQQTQDPGRRAGRSATMGAVLSLLVIAAAPAIPGNLMAADAYTWKHVAIWGGGFVTGVVFHPTEKDLIYARTDTCGAYRWVPATKSWEAMLDQFHGADFMGVESIAVDPTDPETVYVACGWSNDNNGLHTVLRSTNRGVTFTRLDTPFPMGANNDGRSNGERMQVDPNDPSVLFYAAHSGLFRSTDRATTWTRVASFPVQNTANGVGPNAVLFVPTSGQRGAATPTLFVGASQPGANLFRSDDAGVTWQQVDTGSATELVTHRLAVDGLGHLYATFSNAAGPNGASRGAVLKIDLATNQAAVVTPTGGGGMGGVSVDRQDPRVVAVSTIDRWTGGDTIHLSTDGGATWTDSCASAKADYVNAPWMAWRSDKPGFGHWTGDCAIDPFDSNRLFYICGGGLLGTTTLRATTDRVFGSFSDGINCMGAGQIIAPPTGPTLYAAFWDIGSFILRDLTKSPPMEDHCFPIGGSNLYIDYAEADPALVARVSYGVKNHGAWSNDFGRTWTEFGGNPPGAKDFPGSIAVSAKGSSLVWKTRADVPWRSSDHGATWTATTGAAVSGSTIADRAEDGVFYHYDGAAGRFLVSTDGGASFTVANPAMPRNGGTPVAAFGRAGDVWLPTDQGLWHSTDRGVTWNRLLPGQAISTLGLGKAAPGADYPAIYLYARLGSDAGFAVHRSIDGGASWSRINDGPNHWGWVGQVRGDQRTFGTVYVGARNYGLIHGEPADGMPMDGTYELAASDGRRLDAANLSQERPDRQGAADATSRLWILRNLGANQVRLTNARTGLELGLGAPGSLSVSAVLGSWRAEDGQRWRLTAADGRQALVVPTASGPTAWVLAPATPTGLRATAGDRRTMLSWTGSSGATGYRIARASGDGAFTPVATVDGGTTTWRDRDLTNGTTYRYTVAALCPGLEGVPSAAVMASPTPTVALASYALRSDALDGTGHGHDGTLPKGQRFGTGEDAGAIFEGSGTITVPASIREDFTVVFRIRTTTPGPDGSQWWQGQGLIDGEVSGWANDWGISLVAGRIAFGIGGPDTTIISHAAVTDGAWHQVAVTRNSVSGAIAILIDGVPSGSGSGPLGIRNAPPLLTLGGIAAGGGRFTGRIADVVFFDRQLDPEDLRQPAGH